MKRYKHGVRSRFACHSGASPAVIPSGARNLLFLQTFKSGFTIHTLTADSSLRSEWHAWRFSVCTYGAA